VTEGKVIRAREFRRAMTPAEVRLWKYLRGNRMHGLQFRRQQIIDGFIVDFYCHSVGLIVEVDGPIHASPDSYDVERDRILAGRNLHVMRFSNNAVLNNTQAVLTHISRFFRDHS
jgi:very-short-patch-repair endonuclease